MHQHTFTRGYTLACIFAFADTFHVDLAGLPKFATVFTLSDGTTLLLDLEKRAVDVFAVGRPVPLDACFAR